MPRDDPPDPRRLSPSMARLPLRAVYNVAELARAMHMDRRKLRRVLVKLGIPVSRLGKCWTVYLSDLENSGSPIWEGIRAAARLRRAEDSLNDPAPDGRKRPSSDI